MTTISGRPHCGDVPWSDSLTDYDRTHLSVYLCLLKMKKAEETDEAMCITALGLDVRLEPARSTELLAQHLARARWMTETGYKYLLREP